MRLELECTCGAKIIAIYNADPRSYQDDERDEAGRRIDEWRDAHRACIPVSRKPAALEEEPA